MSTGKENLGKESGTKINNSRSCFAVLAESSEEVNVDLDFLKQRIKNLTTGPKSWGHETAQVKLDRGRQATNGLHKNGWVA